MASSSSGVSPLVPIAPTTSPSTTSGMPPVSADPPCRASAPSRPWETWSSRTRLGRTKIAAVLALSSATRELATCAPAVRRSWTSSPAGATTAITTRCPRSFAYSAAASIAASAPASSMTRRVRTTSISGSFRVQDRRPDGVVVGDEKHVPAGAAEREVDGSGEADLADERSVRGEDLDPVAGRGVEVPLGVDLQPVRVIGGADRQHAPPGEATAVLADVECQQVMGLAVVGHVQRPLVGSEREAVRLVEPVGRDRELVGGRVVAIDEVAGFGPRPEALQVAVARVGEPDRPVAADHHVVGGVEARVAPLDDRLRRAGRAMHTADVRGGDEGGVPGDA